MRFGDSMLLVLRVSMLLLIESVTRPTGMWNCPSDLVFTVGSLTCESVKSIGANHFSSFVLSNSMKEISDWINYSLSGVLPVRHYLYSKETSSRRLRMHTAFHAERQNVFSFNASLRKRWDKVIQWTGTDRLCTSFFPENYPMPKHGCRTSRIMNSETIVQYVLSPKMHLILFAARGTISI